MTRDEAREAFFSVVEKVPDLLLRSLLRVAAIDFADAAAKEVLEQWKQTYLKAGVRSGA